jgi:hypothetical protein
MARAAMPFALETSKLDLPSRSELCRQSRTHPRSLPTPSGRAFHWVAMITSSAQTKRPVFKPAAENNRRCRRRPIARCTSSMSISAWGPGPIWQPGMCIEQESSAAVKSKVELLPSIGLWAKSWGKSLINLLAASFGSWTIARLIEGRRPPTGCVTDGPTQSSFIHRSTPAGWNQIEIYFSIVQRKVLTPNDFSSPQELGTAPACLSVPLRALGTALQLDLHSPRSQYASGENRPQTASSRSLTEYVTVIPNVSTKLESPGCRNAFLNPFNSFIGPNSLAVLSRVSLAIVLASSWCVFLHTNCRWSVLDALQHHQGRLGYFNEGRQLF